jgi:glycosyltransferase involved in cell wall biosynthesis
MKVSVIIPVRDGARYIASAIESVLGQSEPPAELLIVDDGSRDATADIVSTFSQCGVRSIQQAPQGAAAARNTGVKLARHQLLAFLDADDLWTSTKLEQQCAELRSDAALEMVFSHVRQFVSPDVEATRRARLRCPNESFPGYLAGTMLIRRESFERVGLFETEWAIGEFLAWYARAQLIGLREKMIPTVLLERRLHRTNQGILKRSERGDYVRVMKKILDYRRDGKSKLNLIS